MLGTIVNTAAILIGSTLGSVLGRGLRAKYQNALFDAMGFASIALGMKTTFSNMQYSEYPVLFILSLAIGGVLGTMWDWDGKFQKMTTRYGHSELGKGLSTAILLFCIGTLSILGPIQSALEGNNTFLFTNATLDFVTSMLLASTYGIGIAFAAPVLFLWQGSLYLLACWVGPFMTQPLLSEISIVGGILIMVSGFSLLHLKDCKTLNMLPSLFVSVALYHIARFFF